MPLNAAREPKYAHCKNESETWVMLLEKAYAKLHGCYENLASGWIDYGLRDLTGGAPMKMKFKDKRYASMLLRNDGVEDEGEDSSYVMEKRSDPEPEQQGRALAAMQRELMSLSKEVASMREMMDRMEKRLEAKLRS
jgi:hypothetical protein